MAKRFTSTEKWSDPWYRKLTPKHKCLWDWLFTQCDIAGTIEPDLELASFQIGEQITQDDLMPFSERISKLKCGRLYLNKFLEFQYGTLTYECRAHRPVMALCNRLSIDYQYSTNRDKEQEQEQEQEQDKEQDQEKDKEKSTSFSKDFLSFWSAYPKKVGKGDAWKAWKKLSSPVETLQLILIALEWQKQTDQWKKDNGQYIPNPSTYLNQQRWLDEKTNLSPSSSLLNPGKYFEQLENGAPQ